MDKFYVTTPIYYINDRPHIGHAYSTIAADVMARFWREKVGQDNVLFSTGTDENSKKTIEAAENASQEIDSYIETSAQIWRSTWDNLAISYTDFVRTTQASHHRSVNCFLSAIKNNHPDDIYQDTYSGLYCYRCEAFYREAEVVNNNCPIHKTELEHIEEQNWFFRLSNYAERIKAWINSEDNPIRPQSRKNEVLAFVERGLEDISISRANQTIGIELPFDENQKVYVWVDALINYLTVAGYPNDGWEDWWTNVHHIIGKDIIKFHCIIWPALLMAADIVPPKTIFAHGFFTIDGEKISKSAGNGIDPLKLISQYNNDTLRYYLLREIPFGADGDFSQERLEAVYNSDLANNLGNLCQRLAVMNQKFNNSRYTYSQTKFVRDVEAISLFNNYSFNAYLQKCFDDLDSCNIALEQRKPWQIYKSSPSEATDVLNDITSSFLDIVNNLKPFLPETTAKIGQIFYDGKVNQNQPILFPKHNVS